MENKKDLKTIAENSEKKGFELVMKWYEKLNNAIDKPLKELLDENKTGQYGFKDLFRDIKEKFGKKNEKNNN